MIELRRLCTILLGLSITLIGIGIATTKWGCGGLFDSCQRGESKDAIIAVVVLLLIGVIALTVVFILDLIGLCSDVIIVSIGYITARFILLYLGTACLVTGILVYTGKFNDTWSYFLATVGVVFAIQVSILAIMNSRCMSVHTERVVIRSTR
ncbi:Sphingomyelin phosphodiesterase 2, neutral membrane (Neutral sphingomyelinase) [Schistosoma haematobium]|nr:Sphingomyelin phosphodiesterase 2, neutral membrane (Neutral sphingomyelinase) [Schistosoma haematobium]KAH9592809.1 Sphingomyelin phosphodiesterase 2, neutral membrane (Neutral sphingomyelinase) [Schistosoma haematobium]CAH8679161.1 unnamed protein product [Schistosoma haematobium]